MGVKEVMIKVLIDDYAGYDVRGVYAQHGLSILTKVTYDGGDEEVFILDTGQGHGVINRNAEVLNVLDDLRSLKAVIVSHTHYDHTGGLKDLARLIVKIRNDEVRIPLVAHPKILRKHVYVSDDRQALNIGLPYNEDELRSLNYELLFTKSPLRIGYSVWWLGEIPRETSFEGRPKNFYQITNDGELIPDYMIDDSAIAIKVGGFGTIVVSGCSHAGIVNIVNYASKVTLDNVKVVVGGLHLINSSNEVIRLTINELRKSGVEYAWVGHCTGLVAESEMLKEFREGFSKIYVGFTKVVRGR